MPSQRTPPRSRGINASLASAARLMFLVLLLVGGLAVNATELGRTFSGFLGSYPPLEPVPEAKNTLRWVKPGLDIAEYTAVMLDQPEILIAPSSPHKGVSQDELKALSETFHEIVAAKLEGGYPLVSRPAPGVFRLRFALTDVYMKRKSLKPWQLTPAGLGVYGLKSALGGNISLVEATVEAELLDSRTGDRLAVVVFRQGAKKDKATGQKQEKTSWKEVEKTMAQFATAIRERLDAAHGAS
ncbi:MAG: DUF3313 family protein [Acidobacteria bacterium]|nr:DUF3313 family protein [Acidobacteriota bacterium]